MFRVKCTIRVLVGLFGPRAAMQAEANAPPAGLGPVYSLEQFGPVATHDDAEKPAPDNAKLNWMIVR